MIGIWTALRAAVPPSRRSRSSAARAARAGAWTAFDVAELHSRVPATPSSDGVYPSVAVAANATRNAYSWMDRDADGLRVQARTGSSEGPLGRSSNTPVRWSVLRAVTRR